MIAASCASKSPQPRFDELTADIVPLDYSDKTYITFGPHGPQVSFTSSAGFVYLWYPGNKRSLKGEWKTESEGKRICYKYGTNTYNPLTKKSGGKWNCTPYNYHRVLGKAVCSGDPFSLSSGSIPYVLTRDKSELTKLQKTCSGVISS